MRKEQKCETCKFFDSWGFSVTDNKDLAHGACMRFPPTVGNIGYKELPAEFPIVEADMWCGEHKATIRQRKKAS